MVMTTVKECYNDAVFTQLYVPCCEPCDFVNVVLKESESTSEGQTKGFTARAAMVPLYSR